MRILLFIFLCWPMLAQAAPGIDLREGDLEDSSPEDTDLKNIDLRDKVSCLLAPVARLAADPELIRTTIDYNQQVHDISAIEQAWPTLDTNSPLMQALLGNDAADKLLGFIRNISMQGEGFVIGLDGGLAAATNKTSDFWQGDEAQFTETIKLNAGETKVFDAMVDRSAETVVLKITTPIYSLQEQKTIGVLVIGFDAIVLDFLQLCRE